MLLHENGVRANVTQPKVKGFTKRNITNILLVYTLTSYDVFIYKLFSVGLALKLRNP
jgi:hypothetical protein